MFELSDLRVFIKIAQLGSVSGASRSLSLPKSSVSRSLGRIEAAAGSPLIERSTRHFRLTDAGDMLLRHAQRIIEDVDEAENALSGMIGVPRGTLRVTAPFSFTIGLLTPMLPAFLDQYPELRVSLIVESRPVEPFAKNADVAIRLAPLRDSELIARKLAAINLLLCASPAYLTAHGTPQKLDDLAQHSLLGLADRRSTWHFRKKAGRVEDFEFTPRHVVSEPAAAKMVLIGGCGVGRLPDYLAADALRQGSLVRVLSEWEGESIDVHALYPSHRSLSVKVRVFVDALVTHLMKVTENHSV